MISIITPPQSVASVLCHYLIAAFGPVSGVTHMPGAGMPADTIAVDGQDVVLSVTCLDEPFFRDKVEALAKLDARDVLLMRCCRSSDVFPVSADVTLGGRGLAPFSFRDLSLYRHGDGCLWLVPAHHGPAIQLTTQGLELELTSPYHTLVERADGIYRSTVEIAAQLFTERVR